MSSLPKTFKAAVVTTPGQPLEIQTRELKPPGDRQVLIKVKASGICHSDALTRYNAYGAGVPRIPGHEIVGHIAAVGPHVHPRFKIGSLVGVGWTGGFCGQCERCRKGYPASCVELKVTGIHFDGGHAEYVTVPEEGVAFLPEGIDPAKAAPLLCAGITVFNALRRIPDTSPGDVVAVVGIGGLGHLGIQFAAKSGFKTVAISTSASKKDLATKLGAQVYIDTSKSDAVAELKKLGGAKVIMVTGPDAKTASALIPALGFQGTMLILAAIQEPLQVNSLHLLSNSAKILGWPSGAAQDWEETISFAQLSGVEPMVETFKLEEYEKGFEAMMKNKVRFRAVVLF